MKGDVGIGEQRAGRCQGHPERGTTARFTRWVRLQPAVLPNNKVVHSTTIGRHEPSQPSTDGFLALSRQNQTKRSICFLIELGHRYTWASHFAYLDYP